MNGRILATVWISLLLVCGLVVLSMRRNPVSTLFLECSQANSDREALVLVRNTAGSPIRCYGHVVSSRIGANGQVELRRPFGLILGRNESRVLSVTIPRGEGTLRIGCEIMLVDRHSAMVRWIGEILRRSGVCAYHGASNVSPRIQAVAIAGFPQSSYAMASVSNLKIQIKGPKPADSLSDFLVFESFTNYWPAQ